MCEINKFVDDMLVKILSAGAHSVFEIIKVVIQKLEYNTCSAATASYTA